VGLGYETGWVWGSTTLSSTENFVKIKAIRAMFLIFQDKLNMAENSATSGSDPLKEKTWMKWK